MAWLYGLRWPWEPLDPEAGDELAGFWARYGDAIGQLGFLDDEARLGGRVPLRGERGPTGHLPAFWCAAAWFSDDGDLVADMEARCRREHDRQQQRRAQISWGARS